MTKPILSFSLITALVCIGMLHSDIAFAQANENRAVIDRMDRIERELMTLQRQNARGEISNTNLASMGDSDGDANPAVMGTVQGDIQQQITILQEELRDLRGMLEKNEFENRKNADLLERMQKDVDYRLQALEQGTAPQPLASEAPATPAENNLHATAPVEIKKVEPTRKIVVQEPPKHVEKPIEKPVEITPEPVIDTTIEAVPVDEENVSITPETTAGDGTLSRTINEEAPREHYNRAFRLLNQTRYDDAGKAFAEFTKKFPEDPLIGNAYYWLGETRYIQRDYVKAADSFRQGFEILPSGPKAPDNLLKLAMTLRALNRNDDACVVLGQIKVKFKDSSTSLLEKAEQERTRIGCE